MTLVYRYGLPRQLTGQVEVAQQIGAAHRYYNALVALERQRRGQLAAIALDAPDRVVLMDRVAEDTAGEQRRLRKTCGVYWGTYLLVEAAVLQARRAKEAPHFHAWSFGAGRIGVQLQGGLSVERLCAGTDQRLRLAPVPDDSRAVSRRHDPARGIGRSAVHVRVGSDERGGPVWATWQVVLHRPLPADAVIKWAVVTRRREPGRTGADRYVDELLLTVETATTDRAADDHLDAVAVDLGWRRMEDGAIRVGAWTDTSGQTGDYRVTPDLVEATLEHVAGLIAVRSRRLDALRRDLSAAGLPQWPETWPEGLRRRVVTLARWESPARYRELWRYWHAHRIAGDLAAFDALDTWWRGDRRAYHGDRHLWEYETHERQTALRRRQDQYRVWAADLARRYETIVLERFDLRAFSAEQPEESGQAGPARAQRVRVAVGAWREAIKHAVSRYGARIVEVSARHTTRICRGCRRVDETGDYARAVLHTCPHCGRTGDQDVDAAHEILRRWRERSDGERQAEGARSLADTERSVADQGGAWARRKAAKRSRSQVVAQVSTAQGDTA